jgi:DNA-binding SARP family transcriptional activator
MKALRLALLGPFQARLSGGRAVRIHRRKARILVAYLAMRAGERLPRETLVELLWSDAAPARARHNLRQTLTVLRRDLSGLQAPPSLLGGESLRLSPSLVRLDVTRFERLAHRGNVRSLEQAQALYRGDFLEGVSVRGEPIEAWLSAERSRLRDVLVRVLDRLLAIRIKAGSPAAALSAARRILTLDPAREDVHRRVMRIHAAGGRRAAALRQYRACAAVLRTDFDTTPEVETTELYRAILVRPSADGSRAPEAIRRYRLAADGAVLRSAFEEAAANLERCVAEVESLPAGRARLAWSVDARLALEAALVPLGDIARLRKQLRAAEADAQRLSDRRRLGWVMVHRMSCDLWDGDAEAAVSRGVRGLEIAAAARDRVLALGARCRLAQAHYHRGDFREGARLAAELRSEQPPGQMSLRWACQGMLPAVHYRMYLGLCLSELGSFRHARMIVEESVRLAEHAAHDWSHACARSTLGVCDLQSGRAHEACESFAVVQALQRARGGASRFVLPSAPVGSALALVGRGVEGMRLIEADAASSAPRLHATFRRRSLVTLARWRLREGRCEEARAHAEEALRLARAQHHRAGEATTLLTLGEIQERLDGPRPGGPSRGLALVVDALARAEALGMRPLAVRCHETLGVLWDRAGEMERASIARRTALDLRQAID